MKAGGILFINELNRLPEGVQNVLLPAIDEGVIHIPRLGTITAKPGFAVIATQNPKEFVATSHLSEAILDRFELVTIAYQPESEECEIVAARLKPATRKRLPVLAAFAVKLARLTRDHARIRRGASIRAAIAVALLTEAFLEQGKELHAAFSTAALLALPTRLEVEPHVEDGEEATDLQSLIAQWVNEVLGAAPSVEQKKNKSQRL
jgi:MoxR-like ATPase